MLLLGFLSAIIGKTKHCPVKLKKTQPLCILMCILTSSQIALATEFEYKAVFSAPCLEVMTLNTPVPELTKYTVCTYLKLASSDPWAAFTYQLPTSPIDTYELGLVGDSSSLKIWMFGTQISVFEKLNLETWYEMCIIWNGNDKSMGFYLNGSLKERRKLENHSKLAGGGNVRLGCSHFKEVNASVSVGLVGEMYMFRMWNTAQKGFISSNHLLSWLVILKHVCESTLTDNGANATDNHGTTVSFSNGSNTAGDQGTMVTINRERNGKGNNESHTTVNSGHMTTVDSGTHTIVSKGPVTTLNDGLNTTVNSGSTGTTNSKSSSTVNSGSMATLNNEFNTTANSGSTMTTNSGSSSTVNSESITTINNGFNTMANSGSTRITNSGSSSIVNSGSMTTINDTLDTTANSGSTRITNSGSTSTVNSGSMTTINNGLNTAGNNEPTRTSANKTTVDTGVMSTFYSESETASEYNQSVTSTSGSSSSDNTAIPTGFTDGLYNLTDIFDSNHLNASIVNYLVSKMEDLLSGEVNPEDARRLLDVLNKFLNVSPTLLGPFSNRLIKIVDKIGLQLTFPGKCISLTSQSLALAVVKVNDSSFTGTSFGVESSSALNVSLGSQASANSDGSILLPASLITDLSPEDKKYASRVQFNYYAQTSFFQLVSKVISSSVANLSITNLKENVTVTLKTSANNISDQVECVFWDFDKNNGSGGWSADGCLVAKRTQSEAVCKCNHLTSFAILMNVSPNEPINPEDLLVLTFITYIGCGLSAIFLSVTLITYIAFDCWVDDIVFWITVVGYFGVIFLLNVSMFVVVLIQLCRIKKQKQLGYQRKTTFQDMRSVAGITFLLGITWGLGFFSFGPGRTAIMYLFTIFNSLQGFFIFFFYCVVKENARKQWRRYLCCGKLRLAENSDWSKTATNKLRKQTSKQGVSSSSSNSIQSSSNTNSTTLLVSNEHSLHLNGNGNAFKERNGASFKLQNGEMPLQQIAGRPSTKNGDVPQNSLRRTSNKGSVHFIDQI
ncbi:hypothetical protein GDO78_008673 [Eleutherodactylus coqui]|uniref:Adhesion G-protein coupled receptor G2 n=1 Tax=Eleutherodactylus coqui TaxID=57060 RepID=A0A8J6FDN4_ELECQ|nr:hypothetical protein GDO78_008673 [Eleutherodactylus coqui]